MLTTLEVDLADMYNGKHVEVGIFHSGSYIALTPHLAGHRAETNPLRPLSWIGRHDRRRYQAMRDVWWARNGHSAGTGVPGNVYEHANNVSPLQVGLAKR